MTKCIQPTDPAYFTLSSNDLYDRHDYKVIRTDGKSVVVGSWDLAREIWWNTPSKLLSHIEVLDKTKGFK